MSLHLRTRRAALVFVTLGTLPLATVACSSGSSSPSPSSSTSASSSATESAPTTTTSSPPAGGATESPAAPSSAATPSSAPASGTFGSGCSKIPKSGKGSFDGMSTEAVASAAANNPLLSTLVTAVKRAGLVDTLNNTEDITVFAPDNDAFAAVGKKDLTKILANKSQLTKILTTHVVKGRIAPDQLAGSHKTLSGATITVAGSGENFTVNGNAKVVCGNIQTSNATVYIIDHVLSPS